MIDTHVHLQDERFRADLEDVLTRAADAGVTAVIVPGINLDDLQTVVGLAETYADAPCSVYAAVGIHPTYAYDLGTGWLATVRELAHHPRVVAIGEIGLDYYWPRQENRDWPCAEPEVQRDVFARELELAAELELPVIVHDRDAHDDVLAMLEAWRVEGPDAHPNSRSGTLHAYAGGPARLSTAMEIGLHIGMDGPVTFKKASGLHDVAGSVPLNRLLLETDAPYLTPVPHRGQRNEPAYVRHVAERIAELRGTRFEEIDRATTENARRLFGLPPQPTSST